MWWLATIPFILQCVAIGIDEVYFHWKRGLPKWERIGHPLDTLSFLLCLAFILNAPFSPLNLKIYIGLSIFSCLMVTKDEFVHKHHCPGAENWLHAVLFILHPITLLTAGLMWPLMQGVEAPIWMVKILDDSIAMHWFLATQTLAIAAFALYQFTFWNLVWKDYPVQKM